MTTNSLHYICFFFRMSVRECLSASSFERNSFARTLLVPGVIESSEVKGVYDILIKIASDSLVKLKGTITRHLRTIDTIGSTMTLLVVE